MTSAAQFVEGGVQEACEDACSICLETYCDDDPATVTSCKHEYHLQCILEWSQRSKECPMCWQPLSLKDPDSQELLAAVEQERALRRNRAQQPTLLHRSPLEDYEFHRFSSYGDDSDFEERIMQHLAAAAMGRAHQLARRDPIRFRSSGQGHQHFVIVPAHAAAANSSSPAATDGSLAAHGPLVVGHHEPSVHSSSVSGQTTSRALVTTSNSTRAESSTGEAHSFRSRTGADSAEDHHGAPSSESPTFSESFKSRLAAASSRYRESFTKTTRGFREKLRARNGAMADLGARAREVSAGVVRALERMSLEPNDKNKEGGDGASRSSGASESLVGTSSRQPVLELHGQGSSGSSVSSSGASIFAGSVSGGTSRVAPQPVLDDGNSSFCAMRRKVHCLNCFPAW
eukprot:TRINITY_DN2241_c0_g1_i2.p1 TRINITY_DN2241_c0_g1~~TRINITY_DN2241_c0_g1_i2.p1  ORF type:complete len:401 (-),score=60.56 TRINITY_DN2241_c0_g1_i2:447-1649(-)